MKFMRIDYDNIVNGPGVRAVLWVSGCMHRCKGCHNPQTWDRNNGQELESKDIKELISYLDNTYVSGVTISGGDPLASFNRRELCYIVDKIKKSHPEKSIWVYTGHRWEELFEELDSYQRKIILECVEVVVDGKYKEELKVDDEFRGSSNQRFVDVRKTGTGKVRIWEERFDV